MLLCQTRLRADSKPFLDPLQIYVIKQWKPVWAVHGQGLQLQEIKDNLEAVGTLCCHKAFSRWSGSPSRLVFIPYELVLRVSALTVPFLLLFCVVFSQFLLSARYPSVCPSIRKKQKTLSFISDLGKVNVCKYTVVFRLKQRSKVYAF